VRSSVIVQEDNTGIKHTTPLVLNGPVAICAVHSKTLSLAALHSRRELE
jgi:hypothetical protein